MTQRTKLSSRFLSLFLAMLMIVSMIPATVFAAPASDIPDEMLDNVYLDALAYTYTTDKNGYILTDYYVCGDGWNIREISPSEGYLLDESIYWLDVEPGQYTVEKNTEELDVYENIIYGGFYLLKHKDNGDTQIETEEAGAEFEVYLKSAGSYENAKETERAYLITDEWGYAETDLLPYGIYTVKQVKGSKGFDLMKPFDVFISEPWTWQQFIINNAPFTSYVKIQKTDAESGLAIPYAGAAFQIYNPDGTKVSMEYGGYFLYEKQAPANYIKDDAYHYFAIVNDGEMVEVENEAGIGFINNHMVGNLKIVKSSSDGRVEGFSFRVTGENYDEVFKTDANGEIFIEGLRIGKYTVTEVEDEVSAGYKRPDPVDVELVADETLTVNVHNDKITIEEPPKTGDNSNMGLWFGLLMLSCFGMVGTVIYGRRRKREDAEV